MGCPTNVQYKAAPVRIAFRIGAVKRSEKAAPRLGKTRTGAPLSVHRGFFCPMNSLYFHVI